MSTTSTRLRSPFPTVPPYLALGRGAIGVVYPVSDLIVVKTIYLFDNPLPDYEEMVRDSREGISKESKIFDRFIQHGKWHQNIILCYFHSPECIFLERAEDSVYHRVMREEPVGQETISSWTKELISALVWLEHLGVAHGDLRPVNILLDPDMHTKLGDFDCATLFGDYIEAATTPFYKQLDDGTFGIAGATTEQFAFGSCLYFLCTGAEPLVIDSVYPSAQDIDTFGPVIEDCWKGIFPSMAELEHRVNTSDAVLEGQGGWKGVQDLSDMREYQTRSAECQYFLAANRETPVARSCGNERL